MIKCIHVSFGYVESSQMGGVTFTCQNGFQTPSEALVSLANGLYDKYTGDRQERPGNKKRAMPPCCSKAVAKKFDFCSKCGTALRKPDFDVQSYADWLRHLPTQTADGWGGGNIIASQPRSRAANLEAANRFVDRLYRGEVQLDTDRGSQSGDHISIPLLSAPEPDARDVWNPWNSLTSLLKYKQDEVLDIMECGEAVLLRATTRLTEDYPGQDLDSEIDELGYLPEDYVFLLVTQNLL